MSRRYTYSRTIDTPEGKETFTAVEFDSFDEARFAVEKGVRDRKLQFEVLEVKVLPPNKMGPGQAGQSGVGAIIGGVAGSTTPNVPPVV